MAIVKMKKLQLMVVRSQKDSLLDELTALGCVQVTEMDEIPRGLKGESGAAVEAKTQQTAFSSALKILDRYAPEKSRLLAAKPEISQDSFMSNEGYAEELEAAEKLLRLEQKLKGIASEESRIRGVIEALTPWRTLDMPLQTAGTRYAAVLMGTMPLVSDPAEVEAALNEAVTEAELFVVSSDENQHYTVLLCSKDMQEQALGAAREFGFAQTGISSIEGTAAENIEASRKELTELAELKEKTEAEIVSLTSHRGNMKLCADRAETAIIRGEAEGKLAGSENVVCLEGWLPAPEEEKFARCAEEFDCAWETRDPEPEEYPRVPVKLKNNKITNSLNMVTNMYSLPSYDGVDPNPLMAPFFILFYGIMMADMGYGLLMIIAAIVAMRKIKPKEGTLSFCQLLLYCGISTLIMGALTGGFFGDVIEKVGLILGKPEGWGVLPSLFSPVNDTIFVLAGAIVLGLIQLNTGMVIGFIRKVKKGDVLGGIFEEVALWIMLVGGVLLALDKLHIFANASGLIVLILGTVMLFYGGARGETGFGKVTSVFGTLYNTATGWLGDILSYTRIMALMLAGAVIASVFNTVGGIANSLWLFIPVFLIGHALNFALNLLSCYVHDLRLQCLEYFNKFYTDGGKPFKPVSIKAKYYDVVK